MTQNQHNKTCEPALLALREDIDKIDDQIISLLQARMEIVSKVGEFKKVNQEKFFIRSNREADMIKDLVAKSRGSLSAITVISIWRKIITAANMHEQPLAIAICNPQKLPDYAYLVKSYYNDLVPICDFDNAKNTILELEKGEAQIAIFADPQFDNNQKSENWWIDLAKKCDDLQVFAKIPFVEFLDKKKKL
jgi:chorismate mutase